MRRFGLLAAVLTLAAGRLAAQHAGQVEVGAFGSYTRYDATFGLAHKIGGGVRMGYLLGSIVGVEADVLFQPEYTVTPPGGTTSTLEPLIGSASLVINAVHANRLMVYVLGGYSLLDFGTRAPYRFTDNGAHGGAGVRLFLSERIAFRVEGRAIYSPSTQSTFGPKTATHFLGTAGLSVFHLGAPSKDSDHDGVPDNKDACPDTPARAAVDSKGCPIDSDRDGVPDGIDKCPGRRRARMSMRLVARSIATPMASPTASISAPARRRGRTWTRRAVRSTPMETACPMVSISVPTRPRASRSTRPGARWIRTKTASPTASISAPTHLREPPWTRAAAPWIRTSMACRTASTNVPTHRRGPRWMRSAARCRSKR